MSSYIIFSNDYRKQHASEIKSLSFQEQSAFLAEKWKELSESAKEPFKVQQAELREAYNEKVKAYKATLPKRPVTPYIRFALSIRESLEASNPDASFIDIARLSGQKWKSLTDAEKKPYFDAWNAEKEALKAKSI